MALLPYPDPTDPGVSRRMRANRRGLRFRKDLPLRVAGRVIRPDIVFTRARLAVFVDGCFWHACPQHGTQPKANADYWRPKLERNVARDLAVNEAVATAGWRVLRAWEHEPVSDVALRVQALAQW